MPETDTKMYLDHRYPKRFAFFHEFGPQGPLELKVKI